ncbi:MAG: PIN domain-containing protein [Promethearchaeota archaeon]
MNYINIKILRATDLLNSNINIIVIDGNFVLLPFQFKIDYLNEIRIKLEGNVKFIVFRQVLDELEAKRKRELKSTKFPRLLDSGLLYLEKNKVNYDILFLDDIKEKSETTDAFLLKKSLKLKNEGYLIFLATNDSELRRKARLSKINTIFLRQKKYVSIERV